MTLIKTLGAKQKKRKIDSRLKAPPTKPPTETPRIFIAIGVAAAVAVVAGAVVLVRTRKK